MTGEGEFDRQEFAARVRAARAYADFERPELATRMEVSEATLKRLEGGVGKRPLSRFQLAALIEGLSQACDIPPSWFQADWHALEHLEPEAETTADSERLERIERDLAKLAKLFREYVDHHNGEDE